MRQGRTDAWIAHQLDVTVQQIQSFKREQELDADGAEPGTPEEVDLRAEDDAAIAAELEEEAKQRAEKEAKRAEEEAKREAEEAARKAEEAAAAAAAEEDDEPAKPKRSRSRRSSTSSSSSGGRSRRRAAKGPLEGTFDHGEEGYGLWLDPDVQDDPVYAEHWAGHRPVEIVIEEDQIVIRRAGSEDDED